MKTLIGAAALALTWAAAAQAQTTDAPPAAPPAQCPDIPSDPPIPDGSTATMAQMRASNETYVAWRDRIRELHECRRQQFNAVVERMNAVNAAWNAQLDAYCARRDIRCESREPRQ